MIFIDPHWSALGIDPACPDIAPPPINMYPKLFVLVLGICHV